jgi:hypothetical protein
VDEVVDGRFPMGIKATKDPGKKDTFPPRKVPIEIGDLIVAGKEPTDGDHLRT